MVNDDSADRHLFVWRDTLNLRDQGYDYRDDLKGLQIPSLYDERERACPICQAEYTRVIPGVLSRNTYARCSSCGFWYEESYDVAESDMAFDQNSFSCPILRQFSINSELVSLGELGAHVRRYYVDVYTLTPRRFEELIADTFKNLGYYVRLTKQTRDGGVDIYLLDNGGEQQIVECKRYARNKTVTIGMVHKLLGVQLEKGIHRGKIVTTSRFTSPAIEVAKRVRTGDSGYWIELIDAHDLLSSVECYNRALPPLYLDSRFIGD